MLLKTINALLDDLFPFGLGKALEWMKLKFFPWYSISEVCVCAKPIDKN